MNLRVLVVSLSCCLALAACGDEKKSAPSAEPAAKEEPAAPIEELSSDSPVGFPMDGEEHVPEGELHDAPPLPPEAGK
jgi:hypothetical protein